MTTPAQSERRLLCDLMLQVGPDAATLCGDWSTRDLAAHLVVRERRPDGAIGILVGPLAGYAEKVRAQEAERDFDEIIERVRQGPPRWSPTHLDGVDRFVNTIEFFIHHEDVRRAQDRWAPRDLDDDLQDDLYSTLSRGARMLARKAPAGLVLEAPGRDAIVANRDEPKVMASGPVGELALFIYGRQRHSGAKLSGAADAVTAIQSASFGV
ncbi:MAG: TIGR03085 family metal-binding protein [Actinomycetota bacterium]|nr:TIGR03085 family metal-binding protein [Actinomycetota bacterium]